MAREKNTMRAGARRRTRVAAREARAVELDEVPAPAAPEPETAPTERRPFFKMPNVREDFEALPGIFRTRRLLWLPVVLLLSSFVVALLFPFQLFDPGFGQLLFYYFQSVFLPQGLITFLVAGFVAPRAAYLVGLLLGAANAVLLAVAFAINPQLPGLFATGTDGTASGSNLTLLIGYALIVGPLAAAFASWYRSFLNRMGTQGRERRLAQAAELAKKRKDEARAARRPARSKTT